MKKRIWNVLLDAGCATSPAMQQHGTRQYTSRFIYVKLTVILPFETCRHLFKTCSLLRI